MNFKEKFLPALKRAAWTAIEFGIGAAIVAIPVGAAFDEVDWARLVSIAVVATIVSLLKSVLLSMPEVDMEAEIQKLKDELKTQKESEGVYVGTDPDETEFILVEDEEDAKGPDTKGQESEGDDGE